MKYIFLLSISFLFTFTFVNNANATHIVGGEIYYDSLGGNQYKITIEIYRDCNSLTGFDVPINYTIFYADGSIFSQFAVNIFSQNILPIVYDDPCVTPPSDICIERAIYVDTVTLPFTPNGYYISYQRCCWAANIDNIVNPGDNGITLTTAIPGSSLVPVHNQGARFINYPPLVLCSNNTLVFDHAATDPDGDSLVYEIVDPLLGGNPGLVTPDPETPAPYTPVSWNPTFSATVPFGAGSNVTINSATGSMSFTPNFVGNYVAGVAVKEYRNGILINTKIRTFGYRVVNCLVELPLTVDVTGPTQLIEDCGFAGFIVSRTDTTTAIILQVLLSGSAVNGLDYPLIPDTLILPIGVFTDTIGISGYLDYITEDTETVFFNIIVPNPCDGTFDTNSISLNLIDYTPMTQISLDSINVCSENEESALIWTSVAEGVPPYFYSWSFLSQNNDTLIIPPNLLQPNLNIIYVDAFDQCAKNISSSPIRVYNQCPLVVPNVLTLNGDGINDVLILANWEDFDRLSLTITNRWGNIVYENNDYKNDWSGTDKSGEKLIEGVYFYTVTPTSIKYEYDDNENSLYTLHGFIQIFGE